MKEHSILGKLEEHCDIMPIPVEKSRSYKISTWKLEHKSIRAPNWEVCIFGNSYFLLSWKIMDGNGVWCFDGNAKFGHLYNGNMKMKQKSWRKSLERKCKIWSSLQWQICSKNTLWPLFQFKINLDLLDYFTVSLNINMFCNKNHKDFGEQPCELQMESLWIFLRAFFRFFWESVPWEINPKWPVSGHYSHVSSTLTQQKYLLTHSFIVLSHRCSDMLLNTAHRPILLHSCLHWDQ